MLRVCKHCNNQFDISGKPKGWMANHSRWCDLNPKRSEYTNNMSKVRAGITTQGRIAAAEKIKALHKSGKYKHVNHKTFLGKQHSAESRKKISEGALKSKHRRLRKGIVEYKGVLLDSSWELALAKRLDYLGIEWIRPAPIPWVCEDGKTHNYFPDFYLPAYDLYLDPKNPHAYRVQKNKWLCLQAQYNNIIIILSLDECKNFNKDIYNERNRM
jgi:hypothetical protein